jgi:opacity protein-like surface antigen
MKRIVAVGLLALAGLLLRPATAHADVTFFLGFSPTPDYRLTRGIAAGINMAVVGFEFDYSYTGPDETDGVPSLRTGMMNVLVMTPTKTQLYLTAGGGAFRESLNGVGTTNFGTNIGGGVKFSLFGPVRVRVDYRIFNLRGGPLESRPQRFYAGLNMSF